MIHDSRGNRERREENIIKGLYAYELGGFPGGVEVELPSGGGVKGEDRRRLRRGIGGGFGGSTEQPTENGSHSCSVFEFTKNQKKKVI